MHLTRTDTHLTRTCTSTTTTTIITTTTTIIIITSSHHQQQQVSSASSSVQWSSLGSQYFIPWALDMTHTGTYIIIHTVCAVFRYCYPESFRIKLVFRHIFRHVFFHQHLPSSTQSRISSALGCWKSLDDVSKGCRLHRLIALSLHLDGPGPQATIEVDHLGSLWAAMVGGYIC